MPFDGTNEPFCEPHLNGRPGSTRVRGALRGWRPIEHAERARRWVVIALLRRLRAVRRGADWKLR
jgi:hypothetical protein